LSQLVVAVSGAPDADMPTPTPVPGAVPVSGQVDPDNVEFPAGSVGAMHAFFPLTGKHAGLDCSACHGNDVFAGTPKDCASCHKNVIPANHFSGACDT
jgi:hypothetical protein